MSTLMLHNKRPAQMCDINADKQCRQKTFLPLNRASTHLGRWRRRMSTSLRWNVFLSITKNKRHAGWIRLHLYKKKKKKGFAIWRPRKTGQTTFDSRTCGALHKTACCVNLYVDLPCRLQQSAHAPRNPPQCLQDHIPAQDISCKPRHLWQSNNPAGLTQLFSVSALVPVASPHPVPSFYSVF